MKFLYTVAIGALLNSFVMAADPTGGFMAIAGQMVPLILIFLIMYFLLIRPQQKKQKQHMEMLSQIEKNDKIVTNGGIVGSVVEAQEERLKLEIASGVVIEVVRSAISQVITAKRPALKKIEQIKNSHGKVGNKPAKINQKAKKSKE